jgi:small subunit ribosomal protein S1
MLSQDVDVMERWLTEEYNYDRPRRGDLRAGVILKVDERGLIVDLGLKRDGFVPRTDVQRLDEEASSSLEPGQEIEARVVRLEDAEGNLILSMYQARFEKDWTKARELLESGDAWCGEVVDHNRGGLLVQFNNLRGFVPASHLETSGRRSLSPEERKAEFEAYVGQELTLKVIEVNRNRRRLILSERLAARQLRREHMERLLNDLVEGQVVRGTVRQLRPFGAFVDLGGAEGLIHISELAWRRVRHPSEVLQVNDEIDVYILRLDHERRRIGLSLKRLQPNPWTFVDETYTIDQLVCGRVTNVVDFGAFVALDLGVEGLVHVSELADPPPSDPRELVERGDELVLRILRIDSFRERIALSLKQVSEQERDGWLAQNTQDKTASTDQADSSISGSEQIATSSASEVEETTTTEPDQVTEDMPPKESMPATSDEPEDDNFWISLIEDEEVERV